MLSSQGRATNPSPYKDNITSSGSNLRNDSGTRPAVKRGTIDVYKFDILNK